MFVWMLLRRCLYFALLSRTARQLCADPPLQQAVVVLSTKNFIRHFKQLVHDVVTSQQW
jgi:hypothetical protein